MRRREVPTLKRWLWVVAGGLLFGALAGYLGSSGNAARAFVLAVVLLPVVLWKRPYLAPAVLLSAAVLVEQGVPSPHIPITDKIPMFEGVGPGHLQGADILLLVVLFIYLVKGREWGPRWTPRTHVSLAVRCVLACVAMGLVVGHAHHGALRVGLMEARPYVYLAATYFVASIFIRDRRAIRAVLWAFVWSVAFKAVQGIYVWIENRHMYPKPESYISHEASYFFVIYMMLVLALWLFDQRGKLRTWATRLLPLVIWANAVNDRRASWEMLGGALLCFGVIAYKVLPIRRHLLGKAIVGLVLASAVYFPVMWNSSSSLGEPARAVKSQVSPSSRDADSDTYRVQENANLELNIKQDGLLGKGFGVRIDYALPITDISQDDPLIAYIPHNDVLDLLMRMGLLGGAAMWFLIAAGIISGARLALSRDRELAIVGMVLACSLVAYALMGAVDQGFFFFRIAFITGTLLGLAEAARRLARSESAPAASARDAGSARDATIPAGLPAPILCQPTPGRVLARVPTGTRLDSLRLIDGAAILELIGRLGTARVTPSTQRLGWVIVSAACRAGEAFVEPAPEDGGHFGTSGLARRLGIKAYRLPMRDDLIDVDRTAGLIRQSPHIPLAPVQPSHSRRPQPIEELAAALPPSVTLAVDVSHTAGLIAGGVLPQPLLQGAHILTFNTHKTVPGPNKGVIALADRNHPLAETLWDVVCPQLQSNSHPECLPGLVMALEEIALFGRAYAEQVVANARTLARVLDREGVRVAGMEHGGTDTHQVHVVIGSADVANTIAYDVLPSCAFRTNSVMVPGTRGQFGLRLGTQALTRRGLTEPEFTELGNLLVRAMRWTADPRVIRRQVAELLARHPLFPLRFSFDDPAYRRHVARILHQLR
jgi:glycine hydroxymethyltransferase